MDLTETRSLTQEFADAKAFGDDLPWTPPEAWYALRTAPGAQRSPSIVGDLPQKRINDSIIERNLRAAGIEVFMPSFRRDVIHHRTRKWIDRRFALFTGYVFVNLPRSNFADAEAVDGAGRIVRPGNNQFYMPTRFHEGLIGRLRLVEFEMEQNFLHQRAYRLRRQELWERINSERPSRSEMNALFQKGRRLYLKHTSPLCAETVSVLSVTARGVIRAVVETLDAPIKIDIPLEQIADVD